MASAPANVGEYGLADVYNKTKFDEIEEEEISVSIVGNVTLSEDERAILKLHPKFAIREDVEDEEIDFQGELGWAKLR